MSKSVGGSERVVDGFMSVAQLLEEPRLSRLYTYVLKSGNVTIDEITADLEIPRTTAYSDAARLVDLGALDRDDQEKTHTYTADPIRLVATLDGDEYTITPTFIEVVGRAPRDQDLNLVIERHGIGRLAAALTYAIPYVDGSMSERVAARELDLHPAVAVAVLHALRDVILDVADHDPYFDDIRSARDHRPDEGA